jgi:hypothetical protein
MSNDISSGGRPEDAVTARVDFAQVLKQQLLVYGWILGYTKSVQSAVIHLGICVVDLVNEALPIRRPDVAQHFSLEASNDQHGFYALIDLPERVALLDHFRLSVTLTSGATAESDWPVSCDPEVATAIMEQHGATLNDLLRLLPRRQVKRLIQFATPLLGLDAGANYLPALPLPLHVEIDVCCVLEKRVLLVSGWVFDPAKELALAQVRVGGSVFDFLRPSVLISRPDLSQDQPLYGGRGTPGPTGFVFAQEIPQQDADAEEASFALAAGGGTVHLTRPLSYIPQQARQDLLSLLGKMEPASMLVAAGRVAEVLGNLPETRSLRAVLELIRNSAIERLPQRIQATTPRFSFHVDQAVPVDGQGVFLVGWFNIEPTLSARVVCHCGPSAFVISDNWVRHARSDVTAHLTAAGIQPSDQEHGYSCYVPLWSDGAPYWISIESERGEVWKVRVELSRQESPLQTVRALLKALEREHRDLRLLMDRHVGPAVRTAWAARVKAPRKPVLYSYGATPSDPPVSILVPLYGRYDFADYQLALFADDPEFQTVELIYLLDDPALFDEFHRLCPDLYGIYRVPFVLGFAGANLGFAGANNLAAEAARAPYLLFLNSDVLPQRPLWVGELLRAYRSLPSPGLLGAKLLHEDGSVQHAGIAFRRHAAWGDLWINDHPLKGQSPLGLAGVREVDAVTAACAVVETAFYRELGGFSEDYIIGDFEDSDLCLRARMAGRRNYVALDTPLYHLERQSQSRLGDAAWRAQLSLYNCWLHNTRWADLIESTHTALDHKEGHGGSPHSHYLARSSGL